MVSQNLHIAIFQNLPSGGAKRSLFEWIKRLSAAAYQIDSYSLSDADHNFCDIRPWVEKYHVYDFQPRKLYDSPFGRLNQLQRWKDLGDLSRTGEEIANRINNGAYDVVFAHPCIHTYIPTFIHRLRIPVVYYLHEPFGKSFTRPLQRPYLFESVWKKSLNIIDPLIALYYHRLEEIQKKNISQVTQLLANSQFTKDQVRSEYGLDSQVIYYGVNSGHFHPVENISKENFIISVGQMTPRKGFDFLVKSMAFLPIDGRPLLKLVSNLSNSSTDQYIHEMEKRYITNLANRHNVSLEILVNLNVEQLSLEYNKAKLCVYSPIQEPLGLVPLEAMACGTPVVGVKEGGIKETIVHEGNGLLVERDPQKFAQAIQELLNDPSLAARYGANGRDYVLQNWTWEKSTRLLNEYLLNQV